mmetsp:Transcript_15151/g.38956  ORF Transcript_15151/g.38956 Transcript_15151/m.38956 type:complete len:230 (+) Transcript_15151:280-969(+)
MHFLTRGAKSRTFPSAAAPSAAPAPSRRCISSAAYAVTYRPLGDVSAETVAASFRSVSVLSRTPVVSKRSRECSTAARTFGPWCGNLVSPRRISADAAVRTFPSANTAIVVTTSDCFFPRTLTPLHSFPSTSTAEATRADDACSEVDIVSNTRPTEKTTWAAPSDVSSSARSSRAGSTLVPAASNAWAAVRPRTPAAVTNAAGSSAPCRTKAPSLYAADTREGSRSSSI